MLEYQKLRYYIYEEKKKKKDFGMLSVWKKLKDVI